jgi:hypothetical protein
MLASIWLRIPRCLNKFLGTVEDQDFINSNLEKGKVTRHFLLRSFYARGKQEHPKKQDQENQEYLALLGFSLSAWYFIFSMSESARSFMFSLPVSKRMFPKFDPVLDLVLSLIHKVQHHFWSRISLKDKCPKSKFEICVSRLSDSITQT